MKSLLILAVTLLLVYEAETGKQLCRQATYNVQQLHQAAPHAECNLEQRVENLETRLSTSGGSTVYNITKPNKLYPNDCSELFALGHRRTGVYLIQPKTSSAPFQVFCELAYDGWTIITRRFNGAVAFYRGWEDYKKGFGLISGEHWLGNDNIHHLTSQNSYELRVEFIYYGQKAPYVADYTSFSIESEVNKYKFHVGSFSGTIASDTLRQHNNMTFSTLDQDNDKHTTVDCAVAYKGAFWYDRCHAHGIPTAMYKTSCPGHDCITWLPNKPVWSVIWKVKAF